MYPPPEPVGGVEHERARAEKEEARGGGGRSGGAGGAGGGEIEEEASGDEAEGEEVGGPASAIRVVPLATQFATRTRAEAELWFNGTKYKEENKRGQPTSRSRRRLKTDQDTAAALEVLAKGMEEEAEVLERAVAVFKTASVEYKEASGEQEGSEGVGQGKLTDAYNGGLKESKISTQVHSLLTTSPPHQLTHSLAPLLTIRFIGRT